MEHIDPSMGWRLVTARLERTENSRHRMMLDVVITHLKAEASLHLEGLLVGLAETPEYHMWGSGRDTGPKGLPAIRQYYTELVEARRGVLEYAIERIVVDDDCVVTEGFIRAYQTGAVARAFGYDVPKLDATYLVSYRALVLWPFNQEGELVGEDGYGAVDATAFHEVKGGEIPNVFIGLFDESEYAQVGIGASQT